MAFLSGNTNSAAAPAAALPFFSINPVSYTHLDVYKRQTQFHPEKSGETGLRILKAFAEL